MRAVSIVVALAACGGCGAPTRPATAPTTAPDPTVVEAQGAAARDAADPVPRGPDALDLRAPGAAYLERIAGQLEPGWGQFLSDCRQRLPPAHPLNALSLAATAELDVDRTGKLTGTLALTSGNPDFDRAVLGVIADARDLGAPPRDLLADDDHVHLRWLFARDHREAGPATASLAPVVLPLATVVPRLLASAQLPRAAHRTAIAPAGPERTAATAEVMVAAIAEALASPDGDAQRAAIDAIAQAHIASLAPAVRALLAATNDADVRARAIAAAGALGDAAAAAALAHDLPRDLAAQPALALAEVRALVALGRTTDARQAIAIALTTKPTDATALAAFALAPTPARIDGLAARFARARAATRAALCTALGTPAALASVATLATLGAGLHDADALVRASCADAARALGRAGQPLAPRLAELAARDRDRDVRARALVALAGCDSQLFATAAVAASADDAPNVRAAYARALAQLSPQAAAPALRALVADRDPDVRAAAWASIARLSAALADGDELAARAAADPAPAVRIAAVPSIADDAALDRLTGDAAADVRAAALVRTAALHGRVATERPLLDRLVAAPPASAERVRIALAWLLAPAA